MGIGQTDQIDSWDTRLQEGHVVILFTDLESFTELVTQLGDARARVVIEEHDTILRRCVRAQKGLEIQHTGDGMIAGFPSARRALACTIALQREFQRYNRDHSEAPLNVRAGLNAGEILVSGKRLFGAAVIAAARICDRAKPTTILVSDIVRQLAVGGDFLFTERSPEKLKGFPEPTALFEVTWDETQPEGPRVSQG